MSSRAGPRDLKGAAAPRVHNTILGAAADLYLFLWNRREAAPGIEITGDASVLRLFRENLQIRWS